MQEVSLGIEFHDRVERTIGAVVPAASIRDPDVSLGVHGNCARGAQGSPGRQLEEMIDPPVQVRPRMGRNAALS
jgi:hypothetical protein